MTEAEWLLSRDPDALLDFLHGEAACRHLPQPSRRKLRLFACACCRRIWHLLPEAGSRRAVKAAERNSGLTDRECQVLKQLRDGLANKEIAQRLDINVATVKLHLRTMSKKLDVRNRTELVLKAIQLGLA